MTQKTRPEIINDINEEIVSNSEKRVTPAKLREILVDIVDSISILTVDQNIVSANFSTPETRNTRAGLESLDKVGIVPGYVSADNTALGFHCLYANYNGDGNTGAGSYSLGCNIYGEENTSTGFHALSMNLDGDRNTADGTHALKGNKHGNNNIGIGAYAGYYIGENDSFKFYLGSHNLTHAETCSNPEGSGVTPLMYGDLLNNILVVGYNGLHGEGRLQVNGSITPSRKLTEASGTGSLGSYNYPWQRVYTREVYTDTSSLSFNGSLLPSEDSSFNLGSDDFKWNKGSFNQISVDGLAVINDLQYNTVTNSQYLNKNLYLASSGTNPLNAQPSPYLTDEGIDGGGLIIQSSGVSYRRNYSILYRAPNLTWTYAGTPQAKSSWESNISFVVAPNCFVKTDRVIGRNKLLLSKDDATRNGITIDNQIAVGKEALRDEYYTWTYGGDYNHVVESGKSTYSQNVFAKGSGISIQNNEFSRYDGALTYLYGFSSSYDDKNGKVKKRIIGYNGSPSGVSSFVLDAKAGNAGYSNKTTDFDPITTFNVYGSGNSVVRNSSDTKASIQLSVGGNALVDGLDISHLEADNKTTVSVVDNSVSTEVFNFGKTSFSLKTALSMLQNSGVVPTESSHANLIVRPNSSPTRSQSIFLQDDQGREFDLLVEAGDIFDNNFVYHDLKRNTLLGSFNTDTKDKIYASGGYENTATGFEALNGLVTGSGNVALGYRSGYKLTSGNNNILIGNDLGSGNFSNSLLIGNKNNVIVYGQIPTSAQAGFFGISDRFEVTKPGVNEKLEVVQTSNHTIIKKVARGRNLPGAFVDDLGGFIGDKPISSLYFDFEGATTHRLLELNASGTLNSAYVFSNTKPYATLKGDLNLYGAVRFSDGSSITTASGLQISAGVGIGIASVSGVKQISFNVGSIPAYSGSAGNVNSNLVVETSGVVNRFPVSQLMQYINHTNPQMYFPCSGGYNLVLSNNSAIYHDKNCNSIFGGTEAGDDAEGFTNSVVLGTQAGQQAFFNNTSNLTIDTASVFIGYNAGRLSRNADNSIFIGPSAGQHSINTDNSIFIGNSAGESSKASKSIAIGDNTLEGVDGENNLEIVANREDFNRIIGGAVDHKLNVGGIYAGETCVGRASVGGAARVFPTASVESSSKFGDSTVPIHKFFNHEGNLVAYIDQQGNLVLKGVVTVSSYLNESNLVPGIMPTGLPCGNQNMSGNTPTSIPPNNGGSGSNSGGGEVVPSEGYMLSYTTIYSEI